MTNKPEITIYGIKNCDTIKKTLKWLEDNGVSYKFHDYRKDGIDEKQLRLWEEELGWDNMLNRRGTTWRKLPDDVKDSINKESAIGIMLENPAIIKRPLTDLGTERKIGFNALVKESGI